MGTVILPKTVDELIQVHREGVIIGAGSNTAFDRAEAIVKTRCLDRVTFLPGHCVRAECGVSMPKLAYRLAKHGLGGLEYMGSIPGTLGGAIFMNAGTLAVRREISDVLISVEVLRCGRRETLPRSECHFSTRWSMFHEEPETVILAATLQLHPIKIAKGIQLIKERLAYVRRTQDRSFPNLGTLFSHGYRHRSSFARIRCGNIVMPQPNWCHNLGGATSEDLKKFLAIIKAQHRRNPTLEVRLH